MAIDLSKPITQAEFGELVGITQQGASQLIATGVITDGAPGLLWVRAYAARLREQAAGRSQALAAERAALARSQREGQEIKNAVARKEFAPIAVLGDVLGMAATGVSDRMDALRDDLRRRFPTLSEPALLVIDGVIADARAEWVRATSSLTLPDVGAHSDLDALASDADGDEDAAELPPFPADL